MPIRGTKMILINQEMYEIWAPKTKDEFLNVLSDMSFPLNGCFSMVSN